MKIPYAIRHTPYTLLVLFALFPSIYINNAYAWAGGRGGGVEESTVQKISSTLKDNKQKPLIVNVKQNLEKTQKHKDKCRAFCEDDFF